METTEIIKKTDALIKFGNTKEQITALAKDVAEVEIVDASSLQIATNISVKLNGILKKVESKRKELKEPYLDAGKVIDNIAKELSEDGKKAIESAKAKILFYNDRQKEIKVEELSNNEDSQFPISKAEIVQQVKEEAVSGIRKSWDYSIDNYDNIPIEWLTLDVEKVKDYIREHKDTLKDGEVVNGIKFFKKEAVVLR